MEAPLVRLALVVALVLGVAAIGWWWQRRSQRVRTDGQGRFAEAELAQVGLASTDTATLALLFGSPTCAPCAAVKRVLTEVAAERDDLRWVDLDAADHLELAARHHVLRVPTLFVLDRSGRILARTSGVPAARELTAIIDAGRDASRGVGVPVGIPE